MTTLKLTASDTKPTVMRVTNEGDPVDLTGYGVVLKIAYPQPLVKAAVVTDAANGIAEFRWASSDLIAGTFGAELMVTCPVGEETSEDFTLLIGPRKA